jgi:2-polyprenyl-3-methyl-5-hydroxy-6-metoxy-1,4-benzoquinol methylase
LTETSPGTRCLICGSEAATTRYRITRFRVMSCDDCEQVFLDPLPDENEIRTLFASLYTTGDGSVPELKEYYGYCFDDEPDNPLVQQYEEWLAKIEEQKKPGRVLDVGCGTGLFLSVARRRGWEPFGIDESVEATDHARNHFGLTPWVGEFEAFTGEGMEFDLITGWDVIEHSRDPVALMACSRKCLAPAGVVALSTPNQRSILDLVAGAMYRATGGRLTKPLEKFYIEQHFLYFTPHSLEHCLSLAGLEMTRLDLEMTDLRRLTLSPGVRLGLHSMFLASRLLGRENRIFSIARASAEQRR